MSHLCAALCPRWLRALTLGVPSSLPPLFSPLLISPPRVTQGGVLDKLSWASEAIRPAISAARRETSCGAAAASARLEELRQPAAPPPPPPPTNLQRHLRRPSTYSPLEVLAHKTWLDDGASKSVDGARLAAAGCSSTHRMTVAMLLPARQLRQLLARLLGRVAMAPHLRAYCTPTQRAGGGDGLDWSQPPSFDVLKHHTHGQWQCTIHIRVGLAVLTGQGTW